MFTYSSHYTGGLPRVLHPPRDPVVLAGPGVGEHKPLHLVHLVLDPSSTLLTCPARSWRAPTSTSADNKGQYTTPPLQNTSGRWRPPFQTRPPVTWTRKRPASLQPIIISLIDNLCSESISVYKFKKTTSPLEYFHKSRIYSYCI